MRSSRSSNRLKWVVLLTVLAALAYVLNQAAAPPDVAPGNASTALPSSGFVASGGLVPDTDASVPAASDALRHAAVAPPPAEDASTF